MDDWLTEELAPWGLTLQRELAWFEKAELEGSSVLRYILAHNFTGLLQARAAPVAPLGDAATSPRPRCRAPSPSHTPRPVAF